MLILRMTVAQHAVLKDHLLTEDSREAVAIALCGRQSAIGRELFAVREVILVPHEDCARGSDFVQWPTGQVRAALTRCQAEGLALLKLHSHPNGPLFFSSIDDRSDQELLSAVARRLGGRHLSAVMGGPNGRLLARAVRADGTFTPADRVTVVGDDITVWDPAAGGGGATFDLRHRQLFGDYTTDLLKRLTVGVAGVSGTGSPVVEMLVRLGVGRLVLVDDDVVEPKNLNRIFGSTQADADAARPKVEVVGDHIEHLGLGTGVERFARRLKDGEVQAALGVCDVVFGCMDSVIGRDQLSQLTTRCLAPYLDLGVRLDADGEGGISSISAAVHYLQPGAASLKSRGVYGPDDLYAEYVYETDPIAYADQLERGYIRGVRVASPAVVSVNTAIAATAVNELLARLHPFRSRPNAAFAVQRLLMSHGRWVQSPDGEPDVTLAALQGAGAGPAQATA